MNSKIFTLTRLDFLFATDEGVDGFLGSYCWRFINYIFIEVSLHFRRLRWSSGSHAGLWFPSSNPAGALGLFLCTKSSACLPSEGKLNNLSHVPTLRHVQEPSNYSKLRIASKLPSIKVPFFASRGLSRCLVWWRLWRWMRGLRQGVRVQSASSSCSAE
jgi:hypothetical protein